jgi:hypothetical protein
MANLVQIRRIKSRLVYAIIVIIGMVIVYLNRGWQLLDDGYISSNAFFPYDSQDGEIFRKNGHEFSGFGLYYKVINFIVGGNNLGLWIINLVLIISVFTLTVLIAQKTGFSKKLNWALLAMLLVVPSGPEQYLSLIKNEKFTVLAVLLILLSLVNQTLKHRNTDYLLYVLGLGVGTLLGKETFIFFLALLFIYEWIRHKKDTSGLNYLSLASFGIVIFVIYRLFPTAFNQSNNEYTITNFSLNWQKSQHMINFYFARSTTTFIVVFILIALISIWAISDRKRGPFDTIFFFLSLFAIGEFVFWLFCWKQFVVAYHYGTDFLGVFCAMYFAYSIKWQKKLIFLTSLVVLFLFNFNFTYARTVASVAVHSLDRIAMEKAFLSEHDYYFVFPKNTEMPWNIARAAEVSRAAGPVTSVSDLSCNGLVFLPNAPTENGVVGLRGAQWGDAQTFESGFVLSPNANVQFRKIAEDKFQTRFLVTGLTNGLTLKQLLPQVLEFNYGWIHYKKICSSD